MSSRLNLENQLFCHKKQGLNLDQQYIYNLTGDAQKVKLLEVLLYSIPVGKK